MDAITLTMTAINAASSYLKQSGGDEIVKKAASDLYDWLKSKFSKTSQVRKIEAVQNDPENEKAEAVLKALVSDAIEDEDLQLEEIEKQAKSFEETLKVKDPEWYQSRVVNKTNTLNVTGDGNIAIQDVSEGSSIDINVNK